MLEREYAGALHDMLERSMEPLFGDRFDRDRMRQLQRIRIPEPFPRIGRLEREWKSRHRTIADLRWRASVALDVLRHGSASRHFDE